jgi:hypothetical protein
MKRPLHSLLLSIGLLVLASLSLAPYTPTKRYPLPDGRIVERTEAERRIAEWRVNWFAYLCMGGAAVSFAWTLGLVSVGIVQIIRHKRHDNPG